MSLGEGLWSGDHMLTFSGPKNEGIKKQCLHKQLLLVFHLPEVF